MLRHCVAHYDQLSNRHFIGLLSFALSLFHFLSVFSVSPQAGEGGETICIQIFIFCSASRATQTKTIPSKNLHSKGKDQPANHIPLTEE